MYPNDPRVRARIDEYLEWQHEHVRMGCAMYFRKKVIEPMLLEKLPDETEIEKWLDLMEESLDLVEHQWLMNTKFIAGDKVTAADIFAACEIEQTSEFPVNILLVGQMIMINRFSAMAGYNPTKNRPKLKAWLKAVRDNVDFPYHEAHKQVYQWAARMGRALEL